MEDISKIIEEFGFPCEYHHFDEGKSPAPPFVVFLYPGSHNFSADGGVYKEVSKLDIELYTDKKDFKAEEKVESVLKKYNIFYQKTESYITSEMLYEVLYETEVLNNG